VPLLLLLVLLLLGRGALLPFFPSLFCVFVFVACGSPFFLLVLGVRIEGLVCVLRGLLVGV